MPESMSLSPAVPERELHIRVVADGVVGLRGRDGRAHLGASGRLLRAALEAELRRDGDRKQHAEDQEHDEQLDQREPAFLTGAKAPAESGDHSVYLLWDGTLDGGLAVQLDRGLCRRILTPSIPSRE